MDIHIQLIMPRDVDLTCLVKFIHKGIPLSLSRMIWSKDVRVCVCLCVEAHYKEMFNSMAEGRHIQEKSAMSTFLKKELRRDRLNDVGNSFANCFLLCVSPGSV